MAAELAVLLVWNEDVLLPDLGSLYISSWPESREPPEPSLIGTRARGGGLGSRKARGAVLMFVLGRRSKRGEWEKRCHHELVRDNGCPLEMKLSLRPTGLLAIARAAGSMVGVMMDVWGV